MALTYAPQPARGPYYCQPCDVSTGTERSLRRHLKAKTHCEKTGSVSKTYPCSRCSKTFNRLDQCQRHEKEGHDGLKRKAPKQSTEPRASRKPRLIEQSPTVRTSAGSPSPEIGPIFQIAGSAERNDLIERLKAIRGKRHSDYATASSPHDEGLDVGATLVQIHSVQHVGTQFQEGCSYTRDDEASFLGHEDTFDTFMHGTAVDEHNDDLLRNMDEVLGNHEVRQSEVSDAPWTGFRSSCLQHVSIEPSQADAWQWPSYGYAKHCQLCRKALPDNIEEIKEHLDAHGIELGTAHVCTCKKSFIFRRDFLRHRQECKISRQPSQPESSSRRGDEKLLQWEQIQLYSYREFIGNVAKKDFRINLGLDSQSDSAHMAASNALKRPHAKQSVRSVPVYVSYMQNNGPKNLAGATPDSPSLRFILKGGRPNVQATSDELLVVMDTASSHIDQYRVQPLTFAALTDNSAEISDLLANGASPASYHPGDCAGTALWAAVLHSQRGAVEAFSKLHEVRKAPQLLDGDYSNMPLFSLPGLGPQYRFEATVLNSSLALAVHNDDVSMVALLLENGAVPVVPITTYRFGEAKPLCLPMIIHVAYHNYHDILPHLLAAAVDPYEASPGYGNALALFASHGNYTAVEALLKHGRHGVDPNVVADGLPALAEAAKAGSLATMKLLLDHHADIDLQGEANIVTTRVCCKVSGPTALMVAVRYNRYDAAKMLLSLGANVNCEGALYGSALGEAVHRGFDQLADLCIEHGADVEAHCIECDGPCEVIEAYVKSKNGTIMEE